MKKISLFLALVAIATAIFAQNGTRMIGFDARSMGRAGTSIGTFDSYEVMMTNPAGLSFLDNSSINANISLMAPTVRFENSINDATGKKSLFPMPAIGFVKKSADKNSKWTWGVGLFTQGGMGANFTLNNALYRDQTFALNSVNNTYYPLKGAYDPLNYKSQFAVMQLGPSLAYQFNKHFSIGISVYGVYSSMEFKMPFGMNPSIMQGTPNGMTGMTFGQLFAMSPASGGFGYNEVIASADMSNLNVISWGGKIGFAFKPNDRWSFGLNYTLPTQLNFKKGKATMDMSKQFEDAMGRAIVGLYQNPSMQGVPLATAQGYVAQNFSQMGIDLSQGVAGQYGLDVSMKLPMSIGYGMSFKASSKLLLAMDAEWMNWKSAFNYMKMTMYDGTNTNINTMIGNSGFTMHFPLDWKNTLLIKVGGEYAFSKAFTLRMGYAYGNNPVPASTVFAIFPAIVEHHITVGGSYNFSKKVTLSAAFETALNNKVTATNPSLVQSEFSGSTSQLSTLIGHVSLTYNL
jgi:long-chain fatty acid transport protein